MNRIQRGFTLMEMLIVVAVIAVLVGIAIPTFSGSLIRAKEAADLSEVRSTYAEAAQQSNLQLADFPESAPADLVSRLKYPEKLHWNDTGYAGSIHYEAEKQISLTLDISEYLALSE